MEAQFPPSITDHWCDDSNTHEGITDCCFFFIGIEGDFGTEVGAVDNTGVALGVTDVARIFEGDPGVACLKEHFEHGFP